MNEHPPVDPRPYKRATVIIDLIATVAISMSVIAAIAGVALFVDWALTAAHMMVCK